MKTSLTVLALVATLWTSAAQAQVATVSVNVRTAKLSWTWTQGTGGMAEYFQARCLKTGTTDAVLGPRLPATVREQLVMELVQQPGDYTCAVKAGNSFGESAYSTPVVFSAGDVPLAPSDLTVSGGTP